MPCVVGLLRSRLWPRAATLALITISLAACGGVSSRFNESSPQATGALQPGQAAPVGQVDGQALLPQNASPAASLAPKPARMAAMSRAGSPGVHVVAQGETLTKISRLYSKPISEIARVNKILATAKLNVGDRLMIPGAHISAGEPNATPAVAQVAPGNQGKPVPVAASKKPETGLIYTPVSPPEAAPDRDHSKPSDEGTGTLSKIRWPATGRVIASFGSTINGQPNAGINIALPENTPVKAAEDGIVSYAGNELTAYGNLVQVRHPNGYFTIYAHAKELLVKRGDPVTRGQPIARSGQTGNVNTPQLHFQVRKGAAPLDPMKFLNGA
jgi:murein DD-endopeptidase MepM/ murein hydrolase activator NlpD